MAKEKPELLKPELGAPELPPETPKAREAGEAAPALEVGEKPSRPEAETPAAAVPPAAAGALPISPPAADPILTQIEDILVEDLQEIYAGLSPEAKPKFKAKGEEVARTIRIMFTTAKVKARKVLKLIANWLKTIPVVNKFFLEQEAAIKTQKIMMMAEAKKKKE